MVKKDSVAKQRLPGGLLRCAFWRDPDHGIFGSGTVFRLLLRLLLLPNVQLQRTPREILTFAEFSAGVALREARCIISISSPRNTGGRICGNCAGFCGGGIVRLSLEQLGYCRSELPIEQCQYIDIFLPASNSQMRIWRNVHGAGLSRAGFGWLAALVEKRFLASL